jgi:hypothetical protein
MKTYGGVDVQIHTFFISVLDEGAWSASLPVHFTQGKKLSVLIG